MLLISLFSRFFNRVLIYSLYIFNRKKFEREVELRRSKIY